MITDSCLFFLEFISNMLCLCQYGHDFDFKLTSDAKIQPVFFFLIQAGKTFSNHGHVLVTLHVQFLCSDWLEFDR